MPTAAPRPCRHPGCKALVRGAAYCDQHRKEVQKLHDSRRGSSSQRGYNSRWQKARETFLRRRPLCKMCEDEGRLTPATLVDHIVPHRGDTALFWDTDNWQPLCKPHHDKVKQAEEKRSQGRGG